MIPLLTFLYVGVLGVVQAQDYALDDPNHQEGTHVDGQQNCGGNYMFPGDVARLGSHSFLILGQDGPEHILLDHRSGTPPHTYQFILRVRLDPSELKTYRQLVVESKTSLPAVTTILYDKSGKQVNRTFFCLQDLPKIFGVEKKAGDAFDVLFPLRATWQKDVDFEGAFPIQKTIVPQYEPLTIERNDVEIVLYRYLPSYLEQSGFRKMIQEKRGEVTSLFTHAPLRHDEPVESARAHSSYLNEGGLTSDGETCPSDYYLKNVKPPKTRHAFLLLSELESNKVLAVHLYDQSPQNYQTALELTLSELDMKTYRRARAESKTPPLFWPDQFFCMIELRSLIKKGALKLSGPIYRDSQWQDFNAGTPSGSMNVASAQIQVLVNRTLQSLMNPQAVARDVLKILDVTTINPTLQVDARYASEFNFLGHRVKGYFANKCYLTEKAARALDLVQKDVAKQGYSLLLFDCYRPQRAVDEFVAWTKATGDEPMKSHFFPDEPKSGLVRRGYIDARSGHSRGSTLDLTLIRAGTKGSRETKGDCRTPVEIESTGQLDMGTSYDCFSERAYTASTEVSERAQKNRAILKAAMERHGFTNYPKEWWHFTLKDEPFKADFFDLEIR